MNNNNNNNKRAPHLKAPRKTWNQSLKALTAFMKENDGSTDVPQNYVHDDGYNLGEWVKVQRRAKLNENQRAALDKIGFLWDPRSRRWQEMFERLKQYHAKAGHCKIPQKWSEDQELAQWVTVQRTDNKRGSLSAPRKQSLDSINFVWQLKSRTVKKSSLREEQWLSHYRALVAFWQDEGHCNVPQNYEPNRALGSWVHKERENHRKKITTDDRIKLLDKIGFVWNQKVQQFRDNWNRMYEQLEAYKKTHGHVDVNWSQQSNGNAKLASWVERQRVAFRSQKLATDLQVRLQRLGIDLVHSIRTATPMVPAISETLPSAAAKNSNKSRSSRSAKGKRKNKPVEEDGVAVEPERKRRSTYV